MLDKKVVVAILAGWIFAAFFPPGRVLALITGKRGGQ